MIDLRMRELWFDRERVRRAADAGTRKALSRAGAFIRSDARQSMRRRRGVSRPGEPPSVHEGSVRRLLFFAFDPSTRSVVVGPEAVARRAGRGVATQALEHGGPSIAVDRRGRTRRIRIRPRPYMQPALKRNLDVIPNAFRGVV